MKNHAAETQAELRLLIHARRRISADRVAELLRLAAAPTFAAMALLTGLVGDDMPICMGGSGLGGMAAMYGLMSLFHAGAWLKRAGR